MREIFCADDGQVTEVVDMVPGSPCVGVNIPKGQWHTVESLASGTVILEVKDGPYAPLSEEEILADFSAR